MPTVQYRFVATGQGSVEAAFKSIDAAARSSSRSVEAAARATEKARGGGGAGRGRAGSADDRAYKEAERYAAKIEREAKRAADAQIREAARAAQHVAGIRDRHFREEQRAGERAEREAARLKAREAAKVERAQERTKADRMRTLTGMGRDAALGAVGIGASALGVVGQAAREGVRLQDIAARLSINARGAGEKGADATTLRREFENAAIANPGVKAEDVAAGTSKYIAKTGDIASARNYMGTFATAASASGASVESIASMGAELAEKFKITTKEDMQAAIAAVHFGGKAGAFEIADAADKYAKMGSAGARFGLDKGVSGVRTLQGLSQIAMGATGDRDVAATSMSAMFRQLVAKSTVLKGMGADVFEKGSNSKTRDIRDILVDTIRGAKGSTKKLQDIFGDEGIAAVSPLISAFNAAKNGKMGTEKEKADAGADAVRAALSKAIDAPGDWAQTVQDAAAAQKTAGAQLDAAWESIKAAVAKDAIPAIMKLVPAMTQLAETGIGPAIVVFQALVEAAGDVIKAFKIMGILDAKGMTPEQKLAKAKADLDAFDKAKVGSKMPDTPAEKAERNRLLAAVDAADKAANAASNVPNAAPNGKAPGLMTEADFKQKYTEAGGWQKGSAGWDAINERATDIAAEIAKDPSSGADDIRGRETPEQARLRQQFAIDSQAGQARATSDAQGGAPLNTADLNEQLKRTAATVALFEAKMRAATGGSIVGDTQ